MTDNPEQFARDLEGISLTPEERQIMRNKLHAMTQLRRPRVGVAAFVARHVAACSALAVFAMASTAVAAAHRSMPGDVLYPVRLAVNDRIALAVAGDADARLEREMEQMERAIAEEELVSVDVLAHLIVSDERNEKSTADTPEPTRSVRGETTEPNTGTIGAELEFELDAELDLELRALERMLNDEESAVEVELTL